MSTEMFDAVCVSPVGMRSRRDAKPVPMFNSRVAARKSGGYLIVKAVVEWSLAAVMLVGALPLIVVLAVAVKLTSTGPAFYGQTRLGKNGRSYRMYKLRTMVHNAEVHTGPVWAARGDSRITAVGKILRDTHLDELPQLWNVLRGEMALVGPRPERPEIAARITSRIPQFRDRLQVRPGVTGLAQMLLPADDPTDAELAGLRKKLAHDLYYIEQLNAWLDVRVAIATPCYFFAAAVDSVRRAVLRPCKRAVELKTQIPLDREAREQVA
jgi:lipopolysaccharide/colanic/teichoic acid biosynthesis glycosyltransferase